MILFGFKGSGKSFYGKLLAEQKGLSFVDTDEMIGNCREISITHGEAFFRALESRVIFSLQEKRPDIIAVGGGAVIDPENVRILQNLGQLVYLKSDPEVLKRRIFSTGIPSFLDARDPLGSFEKVYAERTKLYESIPALTVDTTAKTEDEVLLWLATLLEPSLRSPHGENPMEKQLALSSMAALQVF